MAHHHVSWKGIKIIEESFIVSFEAEKQIEQKILRVFMYNNMIEAIGIYNNYKALC